MAAAFENGTLEKDNKFQLTSSMGGRTFSEILELAKYVGATYITHILLVDYDMSKIKKERLYFGENVNYEKKVIEYEDIIKRACDVTNINLLEKNEHPYLANLVILVIFTIYRSLNFFTFIAAFIGIILAIRKIICTSVKESYDDALIAVIAVGSFFLSAVYALAISWFCQFLTDYWHLTLYGIGMIPLLTIFEIFGSYLFVRLWKKF